MTSDKESPVVRLSAAGAERLAFVAQALEGLGTVRPAGEEQVREIYFDTSDARLYRAGVACVLRVTDREAVAALEPLEAGPAADGGLPQEIVPSPGLDDVGALPGTQISAWLQPFLAGAPVSRSGTLRARRTAFVLRLKEGGEYAFSTTAVQGDANKADSLAEVELPGLPGMEAVRETLAKTLKKKLDLSEVKTHRLARWVEATRADAPLLAEGDDLRLRREDRFVDAAYRVLRRHFRRMLWHEPGARLGANPEHLHDMRVATRRLRAALLVFSAALPASKAAAFEKHLRWVAAALGQVRDLDVQLLQFEDEAAQLPPESRPMMPLYRQHLLRQRTKARGAMLRALGSRRYARFIERFQAFLEAGPPKRPSAGGAGTPAARAAGGILRERTGKALRAGTAALAQPTDILLHRLRIRCKRLRYACEFFEDLFGKPAARFAGRVTALQDLLGAHHDSVVAQQTLAALARSVSVPRRNARDFGLAIGQLVQCHAARAAQRRKEFLRRWPKFARKKTRRDLERRLDAARKSK